MASAYGGRTLPVAMRELQEVLQQAQILDTCIARLPRHNIWELDPCCAWCCSADSKKMISSREFEKPSFQDISLYIIKEQRNTQRLLFYQLCYLRVYQTVFAHSIKPFPYGECGEESKALEATIFKPGQCSITQCCSFSQRSKCFDATFFTSPEACAVPDEAVTTFMSPSPHLSRMRRII